MFGKINFKSYEIIESIEIILMIILMIAVLAFIGVVIYNKVTNSPEKLKRKYINEGYKGEIVIIENDNKNTKEIFIKNNNELVDAIKKEIVEKEVVK
ncbi:MAG: hypothetical protein HXM14_02935 [Fusobacterium periodonticum]|jgi:hypothetical protein|nr:hypothetical protein [Fusobacterium periodonticum]